MLDWFEKEAPIRRKFDIMILIYSAVGGASSLIAVLAAFDIMPAWGAALVVALSFTVTLPMLLVAKARICTPYVNTVITMEGLAAGDTDCRIRYTDYNDCVGRMTKAMVAFRDNAIEVRRARESQEVVVDALKGALSALADNRLNCQIDRTLPGTYEELRSDFNRAVVSLASALDTVNQSAQSVLTGANEINAASDDLARRNEQQAASIEETSAALNQVTQGVNEMARSAIDVQQSISRTHAEAVDGGAVVDKAVQAMAAISHSADEIGQIVDLIDGIAFQTNLLALNAGVEAARAGEAGKGFAVVANEVRALAQRSADAARDISKLISTSTDQVNSGVGLVGQAGSVLSSIVSRVGEINGMVSTIAENAQHQASSLQQVNAAVSDVEKVTQQNAAMVEESTAAARSLAEEARELAGVVRQFVTANAGARSALPSRPAIRTVPQVRSTGSAALEIVSSEDWSEF